ncbi:hypothetical protein Golax_014814, partial [Gossypium laxum]|nr:hypothetical protein [Gossypium laxum]
GVLRSDLNFKAPKPLNNGSRAPPPPSLVKVTVDAAVTVLHGLQFAQEMGFLNVVLQSDSRTVEDAPLGVIDLAAFDRRFISRHELLRI